MSEEQKLSVIFAENKTKIKIPSDGITREFDVKPLTFGDLAKAEDYFDCPIDDWGTKGKLKSIKNLVFVIYLGIKKSVPEIKLEEVGEFFTLENDSDVMNIIQALLRNSGVVQDQKKS